MTIYLLQNFLPEAIIKAIGWTLVHSLWQGVILALFAGLGIMLTRRYKPTIRYSTLVVFLAIFIVAAGFTFIYELNQFDNAIAAKPGSLPVLIGEEVTVSQIISQPALNWADNMKTYFDQNALWIVCAWFLIFLAKSVRLAAGLSRMNRLRSLGVAEHPSWQERMNELADQLRLKVAVLLKESSAIKVPVVIGILKPIILIPAGMLINLPASQVEAILLHELAHIRRKDYLVNLVQCICESVFFFNPAVLWISAQVREERENCCDDMAIAVTGNKTAFIQALVSFHQSNRPIMATAFPGQKYPVLQRVKRIVYNNNKNLNTMEKIFITAGLLVTATLGLAFSVNRPMPAAKAAGEWIAPVRPPMIENVAANMDTVPNRSSEKRKDFTGTITTQSGGKDYTLVLKNSVIKGLFIDSEPVPSDKLDSYKSITDRLIEDSYLRSENARKESQQMRLKMKAEQELYKEKTLEEKIHHEQDKKMHRERHEIELLKQAEDMKLQRDQLKLLLKERQALLAEEKKLLRNSEEKSKKQRQFDKQQQLLQEQHLLFKIKAMEAEKIRDRDDTERKGELIRKAKENAERQSLLVEKHKAMLKERAIQLDKIKKEREQIIDELYNDKIITDKKSVSLHLNEKEMIVNGMKQPDAVHKKYKEKLTGTKNTMPGFSFSESGEYEQ